MPSPGANPSEGWAVRPIRAQDREVKGKDRERGLLLAKIAPPDTSSWEPGAGGRRPGGSVPPKGAGVAGIPSPPPVWHGVSDSKQGTEAHPLALGSVRMNAALWIPAQAGQQSARQCFRKALRWRRVSDGDESLGQEDGAQGVLIQPEWIRGCEHTLVRRCATAAKDNDVERLISTHRSREAEGDVSTKQGVRALPKTRPTCDGKGRGAIRTSRCDEIPARAGFTPQVWGPGAGAEGGREALT